MCAVQTMQCRRLRWCSHVRCSDHAMPSSSCILHFQNACICFLGYRGPCQLGCHAHSAACTRSATDRALLPSAQKKSHRLAVRSIDASDCSRMSASALLRGLAAPLVRVVAFALPIFRHANHECSVLSVHHAWVLHGLLARQDALCGVLVLTRLLRPRQTSRHSLRHTCTTSTLKASTRYEFAVKPI
jgi:hypothetical protein